MDLKLIHYEWPFIILSKAKFKRAVNDRVKAALLEFMDELCDIDNEGHLYLKKKLFIGDAHELIGQISGKRRYRPRKRSGKKLDELVGKIKEA